MHAWVDKHLKIIVNKYPKNLMTKLEQKKLSLYKLDKKS